MNKIYALVCPVSNEVRYIGKTSQTLKARLAAHCSDAKRSDNSHKCRWIRKLSRKSLRPTIWLLEEVPKGIGWQDRERAWISKAFEYRIRLTNQTLGGDGVDYVDPIRKEENSKRMSALAKRNAINNPWIIEAMREGNKRSWQTNREERIKAVKDSYTDEVKAKLAKSMEKARATPEFKQAKSNGAKRSWENNREKLLASFNTEECKLRKSESAKRKWQDPDKRQRMMIRWTPEAKAKQADEIRSRHAKIQAAMTPEVRAKQGAKMKEYWARKRAEKNESQSHPIK